MKLLNLNCQKAFNPNFNTFFKQVLSTGKHRIILLQEATDQVLELAQRQTKNNYVLLQHPTPHGVSSELCILHAPNVRLIDSYYAHIEDSSGHSFGILLGAFRTKKLNIIVGSVHLPAYLQPLKRAEAIKKVRQAFDIFLKKHSHIQKVILAGDFNSILPWEHNRNKNILSSILLPLRNKLGYTYHTHRIEPDSPLSYLMYWLGKIGISFRTTLDHVFASHVLVRKQNVRIRILNKNVSDHLPMSIEVF